MKTRQTWTTRCDFVVTDRRFERILRQQRGGRKADWTAWNQALAVIWLVGVPEVIDAARTMDLVFWSDGTRIKTGQITDEDSWAAARDRMESARLDFINAARRNIVHSLATVTSLPVARPALTELIRLSQPSSDATAGDETGIGGSSASL